MSYKSDSILFDLFKKSWVHWSCRKNWINLSVVQKFRVTVKKYDILFIFFCSLNLCYNIWSKEICSFWYFFSVKKTGVNNIRLTMMNQLSWWRSSWSLNSTKFNRKYIVSAMKLATQKNCTIAIFTITKKIISTSEKSSDQDEITSEKMNTHGYKWSNNTKNIK